MTKQGKIEKLAILQDTDPSWVKAFTPWNRNFVEYFKLNIEQKYRQPIFREGQGDKKTFECWRVNKICLNDLVKLMADFWPDRDIESDLVAGQSDDWVATMLESVPDEHLDRVVKALSFAWHPDTNPGVPDSLIKRLNTEYERIKSERKSP